MFRESEIKRYMLAANDALEKADKKLKQIEKELLKEKAKAKAAIELKEQETDLKNSCFMYLVHKGLYMDWNNFRFEYEQERIYKQMLKETKQAKQQLLPF